MSLIFHYPLNQSGPTVSLVGSSPTQFIAEGGTVTSINDPTYGTVSYFDGNSGLDVPAPTEIIGNSSRSFSIWLKRDGLDTSHFLSLGGGTSDYSRWEQHLQGNLDYRYTVQYGGNNLSLQISSTLYPTPRFTAGTWVHIVSTYDGTTLSTYIDGGLAISKVVEGPLNTASGNLTIGYSTRLKSFGFGFKGPMTDFRAYDGEISSSTVSQLFADGPNDANVPSLNVTAYTHIIDIDWTEIVGTSTYNLRYTVDSGSEQDLVTTTGLSHVFYNVVPGSSYELRLYTDLDTITPFFTETVVALVVDIVNTRSLLTRLENDVSLLSEQARETVLDILSTGEIIKTPIGLTTFVANSESITLPESQKESVLSPFDQASGPGQEVSIMLPDTSTLSISYNETSDDIDVEGTSYSTGDHFVAGGLKVTVKDI